MEDNKSSNPSLENLLSDKQVASLLDFSVAWIQKERWKRKSGKPHILNIDPVIIGNTPRYRASDISAWIDQQAG